MVHPHSGTPLREKQDHHHDIYGCSREDPRLHLAMGKKSAPRPRSVWSSLDGLLREAELQHRKAHQLGDGGQG